MNRHPRPRLASAVHRYPVRVYYEDTDAGGVVYHASYLRFAERARTEALRAFGIAHAEMVTQAGLIFMVRRVKVDYLAPARVDDLLTVSTESVGIGAAFVDIRHSVSRGDLDTNGARIAELDVQLACVRLVDGRPARIPPRWRDALGGVAETKEG